MQSRLARWFHDNAPKRETFENSRILAPIAHRVLAPELWRFTRRSVPRGVALGLLVGIFLLIPGVQIAGAALFALPFRANIPIAAAMTFLSNPATTPFILWASVYIGNVTLGRTADISRFMALMHDHATFGQWCAWLFSEAAPALLFGLAVISVAVAVIGYFISDWMWRAHLGRRWKARGNKVADAG
ncbi:MAG: DUF2062 domain-containing protein [Sphingomonadales bacterium]|nr:MAG: DUF2062 domain-containing protein [Sphingomonadales bacterium]TNF04479.1 MAG: DUF2062 domain-containing protein [Sphingomonadales bacterium]